MFGRVVANLLGLRPPALQVAALCLRQRDKKTEVLLVTSRGTGRWIIPKGWPMNGKTLAQAAAQEAWEEAGAKGKISDTTVGSYTYDKSEEGEAQRLVKVQVFPLWVDVLKEDFPEASERKRKWVLPKEAAKLVAEKELKAILRSL